MTNTVKIAALVCALLLMSIGSIPQTRAEETGAHYWAAISICEDGAGLVIVHQETREAAEAAVLKGGPTAQIANSRLAIPCKTDAAKDPLLLAAVHCIRYRDLSVVREESFIGIDPRTPIEAALAQARKPLTVSDESGNQVTIEGFDGTECTIMIDRVDPRSPKAPKWRAPNYYQ